MTVLFKRATLALCITGIMGASATAQATNAMNMDAYGAIAGGMGGAGVAHETGNSAVMNNPATLGMRRGEVNTVGLGYALLAPRVTAEHPDAGKDKSRARSFHMPSVSYIRTQDRFSFGAAVMAQGGMGTDYRTGSSLFSGGTSMMGEMVPLSGEPIKSELSMGRVMFPLAFRVSDRVAVAAQLDYVWAALDLQLDLDGQTFGMMAQPGGTPNLGSASGSMITERFQPAFQAGQIQDVSYARFDFNRDDRFRGEATGDGLAGKLGIVVQATDRVTLGASYHTRTRLDDLSSSSARLSLGVLPQGSTEFQTQPVSGRIRINDFQWPESYHLGVAFQATDRLLLAGDVRHVLWSDVMKSLDMTFTADNTPENGGFAGAELDASLTQRWKDQTVIALGAAYRVNERWTVRGGTNYASNPISDETVNPLFPAIVQHHFSGGFSYRFSPQSALHASLTYAPKVTVTQSGPAFEGTRISHSQTVYRVNYGYRF
ncbi:outer membrane protein transport protein [Ectothiorhodospira haloalkaliphila]|uniref:OmpP1/FadL family transporter n=1 Tax=Ectothiorhodospira haloalkaliphila TaxID=421628 RepID=UPI001EE7F55A|nr:outer membrane protein transport protein [Ectothiorhodospira haloalkaliphila]MCG5524089.1 outer membrane protein transport protein [Ectothiorhodospira haloalkaliphila]